MVPPGQRLACSTSSIRSPRRAPTPAAPPAVRRNHEVRALRQPPLGTFECGTCSTGGWNLQEKHGEWAYCAPQYSHCSPAGPIAVPGLSWGAVESIGGSTVPVPPVCGDGKRCGIAPRGAWLALIGDERRAVRPRRAHANSRQRRNHPGERPVRLPGNRAASTTAGAIRPGRAGPDPAAPGRSGRICAPGKYVEWSSGR